MSTQRTRLYLATATGAIAFALSAAPAHAQLRVADATIAGTSGTAPSIVENSATQTTVTLNGARTVIDWSAFQLANGNRADFVFANNSDIVLNRVAGTDATTIDGTLNGCLANCTAGFTPGGNIWVYNPNGVIFGANARVTVGGLLATTAAIDRATDGTSGGFLDATGNNFGFTGAADNSAVTIENGAEITANRGALAFIAPVVDQQSGSTVTGASGADVLYGSASAYTLNFARTAGDDLDLLSFQVTSAADGADGAAPGITLNGTTSANQVYAAAVSKTGVVSSILLGGTITATAASGENGDIVLSAGGGILNGAAQTSIGGESSITQTGGSFSTDNLSVRANGAASLTSAGNTLASLGEVGASSFALIASSAFDVTDNVTATGAVSLTASSINQTGGIVSAASLELNVQNGASFTGANQVDALTAASIGGTGAITFNNARTLDVFALDASTGDASITVTDGSLSGAGLSATGNLSLSATSEILASSVVAGGDLSVTTSGGGITLLAVTAGDDVAMSAAGEVTLRNLTLGGGTDSEFDGYNAVIGGQSILFGAIESGSIDGTNVLNHLSPGNGTVTLTATGGGVGMFLDTMNTGVIVSATSGANLYLQSSDLLVDTVSAGSVSLVSLLGNVRANSVTVGGGNYTIYAANGIENPALAFSGTAADIDITLANGDLPLDLVLTAQRNLTINVLGGSLLGCACSGLVAGQDASAIGSVLVNAFNITVGLGVVADGDVSLLTGNGTIDTGVPVFVGRDYTLTGSSFTDVTLTPFGTQTGIFSITDDGGLDLNTLNLTYNGDISITTNDVLNNGSVTSNNGSVTISAPGIDLSDISAATGITAGSGGASLTLFGATTTAGALTLTGDSVTVFGLLTAGGSILVDAQNGANVFSATSGEDVTVQTNTGDAILRQVALTGTTGNLLVSATDGNALLGADDESSVTTDNFFTRAAGSTGTASVTTINSGNAAAWLDTSAALTSVIGDSAEAQTFTGDLSIGTLTARAGDAYAEALDGGLTVGTASATATSLGFGDGILELFSTGGPLNILNSATGVEVYLATDGALDLSAITGVVEADDYLDILAGSVTAGTLTSGGAMAIVATDTDVTIGHAEADGYVDITAARNATLRSANAIGGLQILTFGGNITLGADTAAGITSGNTLAVGACGCGGAVLGAFLGNVTVNLDSMTGEFDLIGTVDTGTATVNLRTGNLTIGTLAAYNIAVNAGAGVLDIFDSQSSGGDYSVTAGDFLNNALTPDASFALNGLVASYSVTDTVGNLAMTGAFEATNNVSVTVQNGALTGDASFTSNSGDVSISGTGIALDAASGRDVTLGGGTGAVNLVTSVTAARNYTLTGASFSSPALNPLGTRTGTWQLGNTAAYTYATPLSYVGNINLTTSFATTTGTITSSSGNIDISAASIQTGALSATSGTINVAASGGDINVASAAALNSISMNSATGATTLGAASFAGTGATTLNLTAATNLIFGAATPGAIGAGNSFTSTGTSLTSNLVATNGSATVNLDSAAALGNVSGRTGVGIQINTGSASFETLASSNGAVMVNGPTGTLTIGQLNTGQTSQVRGGGNVTVGRGTISGDLDLIATSGVLTVGDLNVSGGLRLEAGLGINQTDTFTTAGLRVVAGGNVSLGLANTLPRLFEVSVTGGNFLLGTGGELVLLRDISVANGTVEFNTGGLIAQDNTTGITALRLQGSAFSGFGSANFRGTNQVAQLGNFNSSGFLFNNAGALTIDGTVNANGGFAAIRSHGGLTISANGTVRSTAAGDAIVLASDGTFTNQSGADALSVTAGRWLVYSQAFGNPSGSTAANSFGGLAGKSFYGSAYDFTAFNLTAGFPVTPNAGNRFVYGYQPVLSVTPNSVTMTYDGSTPTITGTITGLVNGDLAADAWSGAPLYSGSSRNAGSYTLNAALGTLASDLNYGFAFGTGTLQIDPKALIASLAANSRTYNGSDAATGTLNLAGVVTGDSVAAGGTLTFDNKNAGTGKTVTASGISLSGTHAGNYTVNTTATALADIFAKAITATLSANSRTYDGTADATGTLSLTGVETGDAVSVGGTLAFADKNAATGKTVTASGITLSGGDAGNYTVNATATALADIFARAITATLAANNKTYDGSMNATGTLSLTGVLTGDVVSAGGTLTFADKNAAAGKTVTASGITLTGGDAGNYTVNATATALADIFAKALTATLAANSKTYDGTADATGTLSLAGVETGDVVSAGGTLAFANKNAAAGKTVTASGITLSGGDAGNYTVNATATALADIFAKALTATLAANSKTYDGTADATGTLSLAGVVGGDSVSAGGTLAFANKNAATGKTVTASGITLTGGDAGNYTVNATATALADIFAKALTATLTANNKTYDGTTAATGTFALSGVVAGDSVSANGNLVFADKNAAAGKTVTASGIALSGADAGNYTVNASATALADIFAKALTAALTADSKTYDGSAAATGTLALNGVVAGDAVGVGSTGIAFADKNAGTGKTVTASGITLSGADAGNYTVNLTATALADILAKALTATLAANSKTYDGSAAATGTLSLSGVLAGESVSATGNLAFADKNAATGKTVTASGITLSGADAANYTVNASATALADILAKAITATLSANNKTYDGTAAATGTLALSGVVAGDSVAANGNLAFANKNAATGKTVTASGIALSGADAGNYTVNASATALADILAKAITATLTANSKTYDGSAVATGTLALNGVVAGDTVNLSSTGIAFADKNAGAGKTVTASGLALSGADAGNYTVNASATALADILAKAITATLAANSKTYDGTAAATGTLALNGVIAGDSVAATGSLAFANKNAGTGKTVTASGITLTGADAGNYTVNLTATALADVLAKAITATLAANSKTYDGTTTATGTLALNGVVAGDNVAATGNLAFANRDAGAAKTVTASGIVLAGADAANYTVNGSATATANILRRPVTVTADDASKLAGQVDPALTARITAGSLVAGDALAGGPVRAPGEIAGSYVIGQGTLALSANYQLSFIPGTFVIRATQSIADGSDVLKELDQPKYTLYLDPSENLEGDGDSGE
jgi:filamentous hemagglutinin family protein